MWRLMGVAVAVAVVVWWSWLATEAQQPTSILRCFHNGDVLVAAPIPAPADFRVQMSAGSVTSAEWTLETGQRVVVASTAPCVYLVTSPRPGERGASQQ